MCAAKQSSIQDQNPLVKGGHFRKQKQKRVSRCYSERNESGISGERKERAQSGNFLLRPFGTGGREGGLTCCQDMGPSCSIFWKSGGIARRSVTEIVLMAE